LAVETFTKTENGISAKVVLRAPQTALTSYDLTLDENGGIETLTSYRYRNSDGFEGGGTFNQSITKEGDSLIVEYITNSGTERRFSVLNQEGTLPFIDMVHWPYELALINAEESGADTTVQKLISGSRIADFIIADLGGDNRTIRHPSRGVMDVVVNSYGELAELDAGQTTRKLTVTRETGIDINTIGKRFMALDAQGRSFGSLSGAVEETFEFGGTTFTVSYGSPSKRGRDLFGGIVPYGERWRTGANRATHFSTSRDLRFGDIDMPAGEYTFFTIPEADGGTFIINTQTGQNGRSYDESRDLGRLPMTVSEIDSEVENFTITVTENSNGGSVNLIWGNTMYSIDFTNN
ncbi:MAG: DUF2911 domain-containing protein, partial [Balneolales bacterium]|nr:DUF2911 domain-containing protein [Balneolales bacterium]